VWCNDIFDEFLCSLVLELVAKCDVLCALKLMVDSVGGGMLVGRLNC